ncbi:MAG: SPFH domain-containing protein [Myxococcota bacterium]|jgi:membrane protease subunit (stomatin/prohibitin family)|nr:SPFH domain-containing protein [Myxococcota bacterium]
MGIWDTLTGHAEAQFLDVIEWLDESRDTLVYRFPVFNQAIQDGGKLVVREGQTAVFIHEGRMSEVFGPGTYEISTRTKAIFSFFESIQYGLNYPYKGDVYFISTRQMTGQRWGTANPIMLQDPQVGPVRIRAFGVYAYRISQADTFLREVVGTSGLLTTEEINGHFKRKLVSAFADTVGESGIPVLQLASQYMDLGEAMRSRMNDWFVENFGTTITDFIVENISLPEEVEKALDKRSSMGLLGDMNQYTQFQAANAIESAAGRPGQGNTMLDAGMGLAMGNMMAGQMTGAGQGAAAPPPPPGAATLHYSGSGQDGQYTAQQIAGLVAADRSGTHNVWAPGWAGWKSWNQVPEVASQVPPDTTAAPPPPPSDAPPPPPPEESWHYSGPSGKAELTAAEITARVQDAPTSRHLVWQTGWAEWKPASAVPEIGLPEAPPPVPPE